MWVGGDYVGFYFDVGVGIGFVFYVFEYDVFLCLWCCFNCFWLGWLIVGLGSFVWIVCWLV